MIGKLETTVGLGAVLALVLMAMLAPPCGSQEMKPLPGGELRILGPEGEDAGGCPLEHTAMTARIDGFIARVNVKQIFHNPFDRKIEAVYVFPLSHTAAVDDMTMVVGDRRVVGLIKPREEAREIYEAARQAGHVAGLLEQERPNIFTQSVANIEPGAKVSIEISYVETLKYDEGVFEFSFPMVVGPRYMPGQAAGHDGTGWAPDTTEVPDASQISPPVTPPETRAGHDIELAVEIDAGMPILELASKLHAVSLSHLGTGKAAVSLSKNNEIPNRDFILRYRLAGADIGDAFLVHEDERGLFFTLMLQPPLRIEPAQAVPRELVFVLDTSGSMNGFPITKSKELMWRALDSMRPGDTFNIVTFAGATRILWEQPRPNTDVNRREAVEFLAALEGRGGTEMMTAINAALVQEPGGGGAGAAPGAADRSWSRNPIRIVCFLTDGLVGNDFAIIDAVKKNSGTTRVFSFGIGNGVNRFLLDGMAHAGRGEAEYVTVDEAAAPAVERLYQRILWPVLADIEIDWGALPVEEVYPQSIPDLFGAKPIMVHGRLSAHAAGTIALRGETGGGRFERLIEVDSRASAAPRDALASLWARNKIAFLMNQDLAALQRGEFGEELKDAITDLGLEYRLMTQFTSFVAVEETIVTVNGEPVKVAVPVEMPDGVSDEGVFGETANVSGAAGFLVGRGRAEYAGAVRGARTGGMAKKRWSGGASAAPTTPAKAGSVSAAPAGPPPESKDEAEQLDPEEIREQLRINAKLAPELRGLADEVAAEGKEGNLMTGKVRVADYKVVVMVRFSGDAQAAKDALAALGFELSGETSGARILIGTIDVRRLDEAAGLDAVVLISPMILPE